MNEDIRNRVRTALVELQESPELRGERLRPSEFWKIRIGDYRVIYQIDRHKKTIIVVFFGHRSKVYDDFERML